jgi:hypothetical protein
MIDLRTDNPEELIKHYQPAEASLNSSNSTTAKDAVT